jgi:hypothetical protein
VKARTWAIVFLKDADVKQDAPLAAEVYSHADVSMPEAVRVIECTNTTLLADEMLEFVERSVCKCKWSYTEGSFHMGFPTPPQRDVRKEQCKRCALIEKASKV